MSIDVSIAAVASRQAGVFTSQQVREAGGTPEHIRARVRQGRWQRIRRGLFLLVGAPIHHDRERWVAHLDAGPESIISHEGSAGMHRFAGFEEAPPALIVPHPTHVRVLGVTVHQINDVAAHHRAVMRGLPVTTPARTIVDLAVVVSAEQLRGLLEDLVSRRRLRLSQVGRVLADVMRPGKPRLEVVLEALDALDGAGIPQSVLERKLVEAVVDAGIEPPVLQHPLPGRLPGASRVDAAYVAEKVIIEVDGRRWHARFESMRADRDRDLAAARAGWITLRFLWEHLVESPDEVVATIVETLATRR